ncbi:MAG: flagellar basal body P-ring formation chaperone FlgA [Thermoguttaceae bacterium]
MKTCSTQSVRPSFLRSRAGTHGTAAPWPCGVRTFWLRGCGAAIHRATTQSLVTRLKCLLTVALLSHFAAHGAVAAELRLRDQCNPAGPVVRLGDVAEIDAADARQAATLAAIELFPAPTASEQRIVRVREIQDLLLLRGVNLTEHRFSGSSDVTVQTIVARPNVPANKPVPAAETQRIKRRVCEALVKYLSERAATPQTWSVEVALTDAQARSLADPVRPINVAGGCAPWTGSQRFDLALEGPKEPAHVTIDASVRIVAPVVVALHPLARGAVVREGDVELQHLAAADKIGGALHAVEDAIGHELVRAVPAGLAVSSDCLRPPLAVHRGEVVTVYAQSGAVRIRTNARSRDEGSLGELVAVESLLDRSTYYARVSGIREVEIYARPARVEGQQAEN